MVPSSHDHGQSTVDNCHSDDAVTNAMQLADLLSGADAAVVSPSG